MNEISLTCFIRACELHNLSKAAQELHISQPALSRRIIALEEELGISLLNRSNTGVELTDGGKLFYKEAKKLILAEQDLREKMKEYQRHLLGSITIGCDSKDYVEPLVHAAKVLKQQLPGIELEFKDLSHEDTIYHYLQGDIDIAYVHKCDIPDLKDSDTKVVARNLPYVLIPSGHRLWEHDSVLGTDLIGDESIVFSDVEHKEVESFLRVAEEKGFLNTPIPMEHESHMTRIFKVLSGKYISVGGLFSAKSVQSFERDIRAIPILDIELEDVDYCIVYQPSNTVASRFVDCLPDPEKIKQ